MNLLIRSARIINPASKFHETTKDILIEKGTITKIGSKIKNEKNYKEVKSKQLTVSPGWVDLFSFLADPGFEHKEDLTSGTKAAAAGGFTTVCCMPNTLPTLDTKSAIEYVVNKTRDNIVNVLPFGAVSEKCAGKEITEIYDMRNAGAVAFSDGIGSSLSAGMITRSLLYVKPFDGLVITHPNNSSIAGNGQMHEGLVSTSIGTPGIPSVAEEVAIARDIYLAEYTDSRLHFAFVSTAKGVQLIKEAKKKGLKVTCSVSPYNLSLSDEELKGFDSNFKVLPPLRGKDDIKALVKGLKEGTIDSIASMHIPQDAESKDREFNLADFGMISLETAYGLLNTHLGNSIASDLFVEKLSIAPRDLLKLDMGTIEVGAAADLTLFDPSIEWTVERKSLHSKSKNSPFIGQQFRGKVLGIINNNQASLNS